MSAPLPQKAASRRPRQTAGKRTRHLTEQSRQTGSPGGALIAQIESCRREMANWPEWMRATSNAPKWMEGWDD